MSVGCYKCPYKAFCDTLPMRMSSDDVAEEARHIQTKESEPKEEHDGREV